DLIDLLRQWGQDLSRIVETERPMASSIVLVACLLLCWSAGILRIRHYGRRLLRTLIETTPERPRVQQKPLGGFRAELAAPPEPLRRLILSYTTPSLLNPLAVLSALLGRAGGRL